MGIQPSLEKMQENQRRLALLANAQPTKQATPVEDSDLQTSLASIGALVSQVQGELENAPWTNPRKMTIIKKADSDIYKAVSTFQYDYCQAYGVSITQQVYQEVPLLSKPQLLINATGDPHTSWHTARYSMAMGGVGHLQFTGE